MVVGEPWFRSVDVVVPVPVRVPDFRAPSLIGRPGVLAPGAESFSSSRLE